MSFVVLILALYILSTVLEGISSFFSSLHAILTSWPGIVAVVAVTAWLSYRWYRDRYLS